MVRDLSDVSWPSNFRRVPNLTVPKGLTVARFWCPAQIGARRNRLSGGIAVVDFDDGSGDELRCRCGEVEQCAVELGRVSDPLARQVVCEVARRRPVRLWRLLPTPLDR
jgi:hypothetical protein